MTISVPPLPECLVTSAGLRCPVFEKGTVPSVKIGELESYTLLSAFWQGQLSEERLQTMAKLRPVEEEWDSLVVTKEQLRSRTEKAVMAAKRELRPDLHKALTDSGWMIKRLTEEIDRLERDATKVSRAYSMLTGS